MLGRILGESRVPPAELVEGLKLEEVDLPPTPCLTVRTPRQNWGSDNLIAELEFDYDGAERPVVPARPHGRADRAAAGRSAATCAPRAAAKERLDELGFREAKDFRVDPGTMEIAAKKVPQATRELVRPAGGSRPRGSSIRPAGEFKLAVTTGIDWFELSGQRRLRRPERPPARAPRRRPPRRDDDRARRRLDGHAPRGLAQEVRPARRPRHRRRERPASASASAQAGLLDALLAAQPESQCDTALRQGPQAAPRLRGRRRRSRRPPASTASCAPTSARASAGSTSSASSTSAASSPTTWAWARPSRCSPCSSAAGPSGKSKGPSLIVVPRSLVFNWMQEAAKFTPQAPRPRLHRAQPPRPPRDVRRLRPDRHHLRHPALRHRRAAARSSSTTRSSTRPRRSRTPTARPPRPPACCKAGTAWP